MIRLSFGGGSISADVNLRDSSESIKVQKIQSLDQTEAINSAIRLASSGDQRHRIRFKQWAHPLIQSTRDNFPRRSFFFFNFNYCRFA